MSSSPNHYVVSEDAKSEESGWTDYLEDFSLNQKENASSCSSLVSDAAWNGFNGNINPVKRLNFKKSNKNSNIKWNSFEDDLEDTASSPVNSPKVSTTKQMEVNYRRTTAFSDILGKQAAAASNIKFSDIRSNERNGKIIIDDYRDLKKRGICLVPMSALMNYR